MIDMPQEQIRHASLPQSDCRDGTITKGRRTSSAIDIAPQSSVVTLSPAPSTRPKKTGVQNHE
jgi:hypothetical protein